MTSGQPPGRRHHRAHHTGITVERDGALGYYIGTAPWSDIAGNQLWDLSARLIDGPCPI